ncbi:MAG: hypothetical protein IH614_14655 [Desulfuromonadales bacterium]|nr:hypothetical protein [Desulfuromonadales bacterium]
MIDWKGCGLAGKAVLLILLILCNGMAAAPVAASQKELQRAWQEFHATASDLPLKVVSAQSGDILRAEVSGLVDQPLPLVAEALSRVENWCEFLPLNFNIKGCTFTPASPPVPALLSLWAGRKHYQEPEQAYRLQYRFRVAERTARYLRIEIEAEEGPLESRDYHLRLELMPVPGGTFLHFHSSHRSSRLSRMATRGYLATLGRDKEGFSIVGTQQGRPVYIQGVQGIVERNAVRYYLALQVYLRTLELPPAERFEARLRQWHQLTSSYGERLFELEWEEYRQSKQRERRNQLRLQADSAIR